MKRILLLGGNYFQMTATRAAKEAGYHVISVDYLPDNPAHALADEYHNISTTDREAVLDLAEKCRIDGIVSYASDVSAPTAAYVAEKLGLPGNPVSSVDILTDKKKFRAFLSENGFAVPKSATAATAAEAEALVREFGVPCMIKPTDSSGSKGVVRADEPEDAASAFEEAMRYTRQEAVLVEEFISRRGYQADGDLFVRDGEIVFWGICDQHQDRKLAPYTPVSLSYPTLDPSFEERARAEVQRALRLLGMRIGAYNVEYLIRENGEILILEIGPRAGGNLIPDILHLATGFDLAGAVVRQAVDDPIPEITNNENGCFASYILHADRDGLFDGIECSEGFRDRIVQQELFVRPGDPVRRFRNSSFGIGAMILRFAERMEMCETMDHMERYLQVRVTENHAI